MSACLNKAGGIEVLIFTIFEIFLGNYQEKYLCSPICLTDQL